jgi:pSer/pThr/pTyr-binding forkhead associated (FHA) protein
MSAIKLVRVGSDVSNDVVINHEAISSNHLELFQDANGKVFLTDLASQNGTFVNGSKIDRLVQLHFSDKVTIADKFMFDWLKLVRLRDVMNTINTDSNTNLIFSENKSNQVNIPEFVPESFTLEIENEYDLPEDATLIEKLKYFYFHNSSIVHIFALNFILFILFYIAFLS